MENKKIKRRELKLWIPFLTGRPIRDKIIQHDEITNMVILLNLCDSKTFLKELK